jgi:hypothetical protein
MFITAETAITIQNTPEAIWDFASDPANWTASNPGEHFGLRYNSKDNRPDTGVEFHQKESVAGIHADLRGRFLERRAWRSGGDYGIQAPRRSGPHTNTEGGVEPTVGRRYAAHTMSMEFDSTWENAGLDIQNVLKGPRENDHSAGTDVLKTTGSEKRTQAQEEDLGKAPEDRKLEMLIPVFGTSYRHRFLWFTKYQPLFAYTMIVVGAQTPFAVQASSRFTTCG